MNIITGMICCLDPIVCVPNRIESLPGVDLASQSNQRYQYYVDLD